MSGPEQRSESLLRTIAHYVASKFFRQGLGLVTSIARARLLPPELFGIWTLVKTIPRYASHSHLGSRSGMRFRLPQHRAREEVDQLERVRDTAFVGGLLPNLLVGLIAMGAAAWPGFSTPLRLGLALIGGVVGVQFLHDYLVALLKGYEAFSPIVRAGYLHAILLLGLTVGALLAIGFPGLFAALLLADLLVIAYLWGRAPTLPRLRLDPALWRELVVFGFPIVLIDLAVAVLITVDRWVVGGMLGARALGMYGIAVMGLAALRNLPGTAREVLEPAMMRHLESHSGVQILERYLLQPLVNTAFLLPLVIGPMVLMTPALVPLVLPRYTAGVPPTQALALAAYFLALAYPTRAVLVAQGQQLRTALLLPPVLGVAVALDVWAVRAGHGLVGVAAASGVSFALLTALQLGLIALRAPARGPHWWSHLAGAVAPFPLLLGLLWLLLERVPALARAPWLDAGARSLIFCAVWLLVHALARRALALLSPLPLPGR